MDLGLTVSDSCLTTYQEMRMEKKHRYVIFATSADNKDIVVEKIGAREESFEDFVKSLPENQSRFCVFDYHMVFPDNRATDKIIYIFWCPDTAPVRVKMVSASTNQFFQNKIQGIAISLQANDFSALDKKEIESKIH